MPRGGSRPNAGRKQGQLTTKTREVAKSLAIAGETPLEFMMNIMRSADAPSDMRFEAAKACAPYMHPRLSNVEMKADVDATVEVSRIELVAPAMVSDDHAAH